MVPNQFRNGLHWWFATMNSSSCQAGGCMTKILSLPHNLNCWTCHWPANGLSQRLVALIPEKFWNSTPGHSKFKPCRDGTCCYKQKHRHPVNPSWGYWEVSFSQFLLQTNSEMLKPLAPYDSEEVRHYPGFELPPTWLPPLDLVLWRSKTSQLQNLYLKK